jgi:hypothetical protein
MAHFETGQWFQRYPGFQTDFHNLNASSFSQYVVCCQVSSSRDTFITGEASKLFRKSVDEHTGKFKRRKVSNVRSKWLDHTMRDS